ncbi:hypothetical protein HK405_010446, partial [Cladochytrium tenue]
MDSRKHSDICEMLLSNGSADVNCRGSVQELRRTPLHIAAWNRDAEVAEVLIKHEANLTIKDDFEKFAKDYWPMYFESRFRRQLLEGIKESM